MYNKVKLYANTSGALNVLKDERSQKILQKASYFGIKFFENPILANELLSLEEDEEFDTAMFSVFADVFKVCEEAILRAQMSS